MPLLRVFGKSDRAVELVKLTLVIAVNELKIPPDSIPKGRQGIIV